MQAANILEISHQGFRYRINKNPSALYIVRKKENPKKILIDIKCLSFMVLKNEIQINKILNNNGKMYFE